MRLYQKFLIGSLLGFTLTFVGLNLWRAVSSHSTDASAVTVPVTEDKTPAPDPDKFKSQEDMMAKLWAAIAPLMDKAASKDGQFHVDFVGGPKGIRYLKIYPNDGSMDEFPEPAEPEEED